MKKLLFKELVVTVFSIAMSECALAALSDTGHVTSVYVGPNTKIGETAQDIRVITLDLMTSDGTVSRSLKADSYSGDSNCSTELLALFNLALAGGYTVTVSSVPKPRYCEDYSVKISK